MKKALIVITAVFCIAASGALTSQAAQLTLQWDPNPTIPTGYALFERNQASGGYDYATPVWPTDGTDHTETTATINVADDTEHAFVVRAYMKVTDLSGAPQVIWSGDSNEVTFLPEPAVDTPKNLILNAVQYLSMAIQNLASAVQMLK